MSFRKFFLIFFKPKTHSHCSFIIVNFFEGFFNIANLKKKEILDDLIDCVILPETSHFLLVMKGNGSRSYIEAVKPSIVPNSLPMPRDSNIMKNMIDQKGEEGPNSTIA